MIPDFGESDVLHFNLPLKEILSTSLKNKEWPLWTPNLAGGFPILAEGQIGTFYLPNLVLFRFLPTIIAFNLNLIISYSLSFWGTFLFAKSLKLPNIACLFSAVVFTFSGFLSVHLNHLNLIQAACLMPLILWAANLIFKKPSFNYSLLFAFLLSQQIFTGHFYIVFISLVGIIIFFLGNVFIAKTALRMTSYLLLGFFLAFCLSAIQLLPTIELINLSGRKGGLDFNTVTSYPYPFKHLITFIKPYALGNPADGSYPPFNNNWGIFWENTAYVGILPLILALSSIFFFIPIRSRRDVGMTKVLLLILFLSMLLVLGKNSPLYLIFSFPPFNFFRVPSKFLLLTTFSLATLSGYTFEQIVRWFNRSINPLWSQTHAIAWICDRRKILGIVANCILCVFFLLVLLDEYRFSYNYPPISPSNWWIQIPESARFLQEKEGRITSIGAPLVWNRVFLEKGWQDISPFTYFRNSLYPNYNVLFSLSNFDINTGGLMPRRLSVSSSIGKLIEIDEEKQTASISTASANLLSLASVKHLISPYKITQQDFMLVKKIPPPDNSTLLPFYIYENAKSLPRAYISFQTKQIKTTQDFYKELNNKDFLSQKMALVENENFVVSGKGKVDMVYSDNLEVRLKTESEEDGLLVLTDTNYPGWTATIDSKPAELTNVNLTQRGIFLPKGEHTIQFLFKPFYFYLGKKITIASIIIVSLAVFLYHGFFPHKASGKKKLSPRLFHKQQN